MPPRAGQSASNSYDHLFVRNLQNNHRLGPWPGEPDIEVPRLGQVPGEAVEDPAITGVRLRQAPIRDLGHELVGNQAAGVHVVMRALSEEGRTGNLVPQHVTGRDMGHTKAAGKPSSKGSLAASGRAENHESSEHAFFPTPGMALCPPFEPRATLGLLLVTAR